MGTNLRDGNIGSMGMIDISINPASVAANTTAEQTFTVNGLVVGDMLVITKPSVTAGLSVGNPRVSAANTLALTLENHTAAAIDAGSETYRILWFRNDQGGRALPSAVMA